MTKIKTKGPWPSTAVHERILNSIETDENGCWIWQKRLTTAGYGSIRVGSRSDGTRRQTSAHIIAYETFVGEVPEGLELDHLCRVRSCCNPDHVEPVTHKVNMQRMPDEYKELLRERMAMARAHPSRAAKAAEARHCKRELVAA